MKLSFIAMNKITKQIWKPEEGADETLYISQDGEIQVYRYIPYESRFDRSLDRGVWEIIFEQ